MKRFIKWILIAAGALLVLTVIAVIIFAIFFDVDRLKPQFEKQMTRTAGRSVSLGDDLKLSLFPWLGVSFSNLRVGNPPGFKENDFLTADAFEVKIKLFPLLIGDVQIDRVVLQTPRLFLITNKNGRTNWANSTREKKAPEVKDPEKGRDLTDVFQVKTLQANAFTIENGTILWIDHAGKSQFKISKSSLTAKMFPWTNRLISSWPAWQTPILWPCKAPSAP